MQQDEKRDFPYKPAILRDRDKDLKKTWYVEFYTWDEDANDLIRKRVSVSMNFRDVKSRTQEGRRMIATITDF